MRVFFRERCVKDLANVSGNVNGNGIKKMGEGARIIWSADGMTLAEIIAILKDPNFPRDKVAIKLDRLFLTDDEKNPRLLYAIDEIQQDYGVPVFADTKIVEIPSKVLELTKIHLRHKPWMLNVMGNICNTGVASNEEGVEPDVLSEFAEMCLQAGTSPCVVTVLTSKSPSVIAMEYSGRMVDAQVAMYAELAAKCGVTDVVCSSLEIEFLRRGVSTKELRLNVPGVRMPGSSKHDQKRVATPGRAIKLGADRLVIGRDLSQGEGTFAERLKRITDNIWAEANVKI